MGKICEKCMKKYDDSQSVCLFCGEKLKPEEECKEICEKEGTTPEEVKIERADIRTLSFLLVIIVVVVVVFFLVFVVGPDFWKGAVQRIFMMEGRVGR